MKKHVNVIFPKIKSVGSRLWGEEKLLVLIPKILSLKYLKLYKGKKGGLQYHHKKNECGYLIKGKLIIRFDNGDGKLRKKILNAGKSFHFPPGSIHQEEALTDCIIIEASTPHFNDRVRVEKKYGLVTDKGLPSTKISEIIKK
jgi:mannose-6-phosphate isomerase-like protein (cupin superfamily)